MNSDVPRFFTIARASNLLGVSEAELQRISDESGWGRVERAGDEKETYYTYDDLGHLWTLLVYQKVSQSKPNTNAQHEH